MKKFLTIFLFAVVITTSSYAQWYMGVATGNWSSTSMLYLNPATIADSKERFAIDILSLNVGADNSLGTVNNFSKLVKRAFNGSNTDIKDVFNYTSNSHFNLMAPYLELRGPGFMINIKNKHTFAFTTRLRAINQFNNFDQTLYRIIADPSYVPTGNIYNVMTNNFNWTAHLWSEFGVTYSTVLMDDKVNKIKFGATVRYLGGIGYIGLKGNNLNINYSNTKDSLHVVNSDFEYASNLLSTNNAFVNGLTNNTILNSFFGSKNASGIGGDIGVVYEYTPAEYKEETYDMDGVAAIVDNTKNHYKLRLSASVTDLGSIDYKSGNYNANVKGNGDITGSGISANTNNYTSFMSYARSKGFTADTAPASTRLYMPTSLKLMADYNIKNKYYVNVAYFGNLANISNFGNTWYNQFIVTPRYDTRQFSFGMPFTYSALANDIKVGAGVRVYSVYVGSDDMLALFSKNQRGFNMYLGARVSINKVRPSDRDGDGVSDKNDKCPDEPGTWDTQGCPEPDSEHGGSNDDSYQY